MQYEQLSTADKCLVHRYLYYVLNEPIIKDMAYDIMEMLAREMADKSHPIHRVGSSLARDYPDWVKEMALTMINDSQIAK